VCLNKTWLKSDMRDYISERQVFLSAAIASTKVQDFGSATENVDVYHTSSTLQETYDQQLSKFMQKLEDQREKKNKAKMKKKDISFVQDNNPIFPFDNMEDNGDLVSDSKDLLTILRQQQQQPYEYRQRDASSLQPRCDDIEADSWDAGWSAGHAVREASSGESAGYGWNKRGFVLGYDFQSIGGAYDKVVQRFEGQNSDEESEYS